MNPGPSAFLLEVAGDTAHGAFSAGRIVALRLVELATSTCEYCRAVVRPGPCVIDPLPAERAGGDGEAACGHLDDRYGRASY